MIKKHAVIACTPVFIAALCAVAKIGKQPRCPLPDEWIKMWYIIYIYIYIMEYYSAIKRNESIVVRWMNPDPLTQNEVS